jgi:uncharacterized membrane protein
MTLNAFDWAIIIFYLIGMIGLSFFLARPVLNQQPAGGSGLCGFCRRRRDDLAAV